MRRSLVAPIRASTRLSATRGSGRTPVGLASERSTSLGELVMASRADGVAAVAGGIGRAATGWLAGGSTALLAGLTHVDSFGAAVGAAAGASVALATATSDGGAKRVPMCDTSPMHVARRTAVTPASADDAGAAAGTATGAATGAPLPPKVASVAAIDAAARFAVSSAAVGSTAVKVERWDTLLTDAAADGTSAGGSEPAIGAPALFRLSSSPTQTYPRAVIFQSPPGPICTPRLRGDL